MTEANLEQTKVSLDVWLDSYEDILFQVYTDDFIVELVDKINEDEDLVNSRKQPRKTLRGLFYTKDYVKTISIVTESGEHVFYDQLTASTTQTSWLSSIVLFRKELYEEISSDNKRNPQTNFVSYETIAGVISGESKAIDEVLRHYSKCIRTAFIF